MHPALHSWRDDLPAALIRLLAYLAALALLSIGAAQFFQSKPVMDAITPADRPAWIAIERPFPAFALSIPEAADAPSGYAIRRHADGGGRKGGAEGFAQPVVFHGACFLLLGRARPCGRAGLLSLRFKVVGHDPAIRRGDPRPPSRSPRPGRLAGPCYKSVTAA